MNIETVGDGEVRRGWEQVAVFIFLGVLTLMAAAYSVKIFTVARENVDRLDFSHYYTSSYMMRRGIDPYANDLVPVARELGFEAPDVTRATNPPALVVLLEPLTLFRPHVAYWIWFAINVGCLITFFALAIAEFAVRPRAAWALICLTLMYPPLVNHFFFAQAQLVILVLLMLTLRLLRESRDAAAGATMAAAILIKVFPVILMGYFVARRRWRPFYFTAAFTALGGLLTIWATGLGAIVNFVRASASITQPHWLAESGNISLNGFILRSVGFAVAEGAGRYWLIVERPLFLAIELGWFAATLILSRAKDPEERSEAPAYALWVAATIILAPTAWLHYLVLALIPLWLIAALAMESRASRAVVWTAAAGFFVTYVERYLNVETQGAALSDAVVFTIGQISIAPAILIYLATYLLLRNRAREAQSADANIPLERQRRLEA